MWSRQDPMSSVPYPTFLITNFLGLCLEGFFYGLYSAIFTIYLQYQASKEGIDKRKNIIFYSHCALYTLSVATFALDIALACMPSSTPETNAVAPYYVYVISIAIHGCCDFISQSILIYRCWVAWSCNIYVVIIPSILTIAFLPTYLSNIGSVHIGPDQIVNWELIVAPTGFGMSLIVNALVTGLITIRIVKVYRAIKPTLYEQATAGSKLRSVIFIVIESGMTLLAFQMVMLVCHIMSKDSALEAIYLTIGIHQMLMGITPTIIQVRVSMALSFHDEQSMVEAASANLSLHFAPEDPDAIPETRRIARPESRDNGIDF